MHISHRQEAFSLAYVRAVAAASGYRVQEGCQPDDDSIDLTLAARGPGGAVHSPKVDVQLKCRLGRPAGEPDFSYDLKAKNYEDLRHTAVQVPRILVIVAVPAEVDRWVEQDEERLLIRHCSWWVSLRGWDASTNSSTVRVSIPRQQRFNVDNLTTMMERIGKGQAP